MTKFPFLYLVFLFLSACQILPAGDRELNIPEFQFSSIHANNFDLFIGTNLVPSSKALHVYVEGDGTPWVSRYFIAKDPGPYGRLALDLMRQDSNSALYLGRPCYYSWKLPKQNNCSPLLWTDARYSEEVVATMALALENYLAKHSYQTVRLIGHSGGGTLAYLIAQRVKSVNAVAIISGNLNTDEWTKHHHYTPLRKSINPVALTNSRSIPIIYLTGAKDNVVPIHLNQAFLKQINATIIVRPEYDHVCCWRNEWRKLSEVLFYDELQVNRKMVE